MPLGTSIRLRKEPGFDEFFSELPRTAKGLAVEAAADYVIGDENHGLKHEPNYLFVSRTSAYGEPFSSDKQRRWFFASLAKGTNVITGQPFTPGKENRTHAISEAWRREGEMTTSRIVNDADGVEWVMGNKQANQPRMAGWRYYMDVVESNFKGAIQAGQRAVDEWIRSRK